MGGGRRHETLVGPGPAEVVERAGSGRTETKNRPMKQRLELNPGRRRVSSTVAIAVAAALVAAAPPRSGRWRAADARLVGPREARAAGRRGRLRACPLHRRAGTRWSLRPSPGRQRRVVLASAGGRGRWRSGSRGGAWSGAAGRGRGGGRRLPSRCGRRAVRRPRVERRTAVRDPGAAATRGRGSGDHRSGRERGRVPGGGRRLAVGRRAPGGAVGRRLGLRRPGTRAPRRPRSERRGDPAPGRCGRAGGGGLPGNRRSGDRGQRLPHQRHGAGG